jgi:hypothetical protein
VLVALSVVVLWVVVLQVVSLGLRRFAGAAIKQLQLTARKGIELIQRC